MLAPLARPGEQGFWVALFPRGGTLPALGYNSALALNLLPRTLGLRLVRASCVQIYGVAGAPTQADGDPAGVTPVTIRDARTPIAIVTG